MVCLVLKHSLLLLRQWLTNQCPSIIVFFMFMGGLQNVCKSRWVVQRHLSYSRILTRLLCDLLGGRHASFAADQNLLPVNLRLRIDYTVFGVFFVHIDSLSLSLIFN